MSGLVPLDFDLMDWHQLLRLRRDPPRAHPVTVTVTPGEMQCVSAELIPKKGDKKRLGRVGSRVLPTSRTGLLAFGAVR